MSAFVEVWLTGFVALVVGAVAGAIAIARLRRLGSMGADLEMQLNDIDEQLEHMVAQLRDLDQQQDRIAESFFTEEKRHYEGKAADLMRERDVVLGKLERVSGAAETIDAPAPRKLKESAASVTPAVSFFASRPRLVGALWGGGVILVLGGLFLSVSAEQAPRAAGGSLTGNSQSEGAPAPSGDVQKLLDALEKNPNDRTAMNALTRRLLFSQQFAEAQQLNARVLKIDPTDVEGRTYAAVLMSASGKQQGAAEALDAITSEHPDFADAWFFRGMVAMQSGDSGKTQEVWARFVEVAPPSPRRNRIEQMLESMKERGAPEKSAN
ncbi:MAG: hypothetical protein AAFP04_03335 [Myxococcota bacterium]